MAHFAQLTGINNLFEPPEGIGKTVLGDDRQDFAAGPLGGDHRITLFQRSGHRFFAQHVLAGVQRVNADFSVYIRRRADIDDIDFNPGFEHRLMATKNGGVIQAIAFFLFLRFLRIDIDQRHNLAAVGKFLISLNMVMRNVPCSHNRNT